MSTANPTQAEKRKYRYQIQIGDRVEMTHRNDPYHPGRDPNVGKVGTVTSVVDGAWGERASFKADDGTTVSASTSELLHAEAPASDSAPSNPPQPRTISMNINDLIDAYDEAHDLRKQVAHRFLRVAPPKRTQQMKDELEAAMEAEERARSEWVNHENQISNA